MSVIIDLTCLWRVQPVRQSKPIRARPGLLLANPLASCSRGQGAPGRPNVREWLGFFLTGLGS